MLQVLAEVERDLPRLLIDESEWNSLDIDYHPPRVERLWRQWSEDIRVYLHCIHYCKPGEALFHPHPWPSAMKVLRGGYEMVVGYGSGDTPPPVAARLFLSPGSEYEMTEKDAWHYVRPDGEGEVALSIMITGKPWDRTAPKSTHPLTPLSEERKRELLGSFRFSLCP